MCLPGYSRKLILGEEFQHSITAILDEDILLGISLSNFSPHRQRRIADIFECQIGELPSIYLGMPLFYGLSKEALGIRLLERFQKKLVGG